tara:strand:+ start:1433 stop:2518 length:1086 start_codon:yes stop_codon:yes gene_type:complete
MSTAPEELINIATRHQVYLERLKTGEANKVGDFLKKIDQSVTARLANRDLTDFSRDRLNQLLISVRSDMSILAQEFTDTVALQSIDLADYESGFEIRALGQVAAADFVVPTAAALEFAVFNNPLTMVGADNGKLLKPFIKDMTQRTLDRVGGAISAGYYEGQTTNQILQSVRGTRAAKFTDGILYQMNNAAKTITRTALQHSAVQSREQVWQNNSDIVKGVRWVSTLDSRTSPQCRSLDGQQFPIDKGPRPPIHPNCRSTIVAVLDDRFAFLREDATRSARGPSGKVSSVPADQTYYGWLKKQPDAFQNSAIGKSRGLLLRDGGLTSEKFTSLQLGKNFQPMNLAEMKLLEPIAFEKAGLG